MSKRTLLYNAGVVTMDARRRQFDNGAILIEGDRIIKVGKSESLLDGEDQHTEKIDLQGRWIVPGLINTHVHTSQHLGRGLGDDVDLITWLHERIWPYESSFTEEDSYISSLLCGLELIRSGVTCFAEPGGQHVSGMVKAIDKLGIRACLARSTMDEGEGLPSNWNEDIQQSLEKQIANYEQWHGTANGRIRMWFGLRTIFNTSDELIVKTKELADQYKVGVHMHVAEIEEEVQYAKQTRGATTVAHLANLGVLDANFLAVHCVWMTEDEIQMFADQEVKVSHCPAAAMRYLGFAKIPEMVDAGICVTIGTDGAPSNNRMTLIDEMWLTSLIHKGRTLKPTVVPAHQILEMATRNGAKAVLWDDEIGALEEGKKADLVVINPNTPNMLPMHDPIANLVTSMQAHNVESVMCDGHWLMRDNEIVIVDEAQVLEEAKLTAQNIVQRAELQLPDRFERIK